MGVGEFALLAWPLVTVLLFRSLSLQQAVIWTLLGGYLLLPSSRSVGWDLPALPPIDKALVPAICAAVGAFLTMRTQRRATQFHRPGAPLREHDNGTILEGWLPRAPIPLLLLITGVLATIMTALTNGDRLVFGPKVLPPLGLRDSISMTTTFLIFLLPALLGRKYLSDDRGHRLLLVAFCVAAVFYSFLALFEVRMSPQLNRMIYGFFPHSWIQHIRGGGFRPLVFLDHGLLLGIFLSVATLGTATLIRLDAKRWLLYVIALIWLLFTLVLAKTLGALLITLILLPVVLLFPVRMQLLTAAIIAGVVMGYPALRGAGQIPTDQIVGLAERIDTNRAQSLQFRFDNEDMLLERAQQRPLYGWGGFGRNRVFDERGVDISITDGIWVIIIGSNGWLGYAAIFGLLGMPLIILAIWRKRYDVGLVTGGLGVAQAGNLLDLIPNASLTPLLWLVGGALMGRLELRARQKAPDPETIAEAAPLPRHGRYSRFSSEDEATAQVRSRPAEGRIRTPAPAVPRSSAGHRRRS
jgi:hypothetical protein